MSEERANPIRLIPMTEQEAIELAKSAAYGPRWIQAVAARFDNGITRPEVLLLWGSALSAFETTDQVGPHSSTVPREAAVDKLISAFSLGGRIR